MLHRAEETQQGRNSCPRLQFGFPFGLYRVVAPLSFLRSISLASLFTSHNNRSERIKNGKTPGVDGIDAEMLKAEPELAAGYLCTLFKHIRENMKVPNDWKKTIIVKVPKKGDLSKCDNFRGIS